MKTKVIVGLLAVLSFAILAPAAITVSGNLAADGIVGTSTNTGFVKYIISFNAGAEKLASVDIMFTGDLRQRIQAWNEDEEANPTTPIPIVWNTTAFETHFNLTEAQVAGVTAAEDVNATPGAIGYFTGTYLKGVFGIQGTYQVAGATSVATIVLPVGAVGYLNGSASTDTAGLYTFQNVPIGAVPEPMTISMLVLGGLGLLRRRMA